MNEAATTGTAQRVMEILRHRCEEMPAGVTGETPLATLNLDSLTLLEVAFDVQQDFPGVDDVAVASAVTVGDLIRSAESA